MASPGNITEFLTCFRVWEAIRRTALWWPRSQQLVG
jgi:hypothetical protein